MTKIGARVNFGLLLILNALTLTNAWCDQDWNPESRIPQITYIGSPSAQEVILGNELRTSLISNIRFWKTRGLEDPGSVDGIFQFSDPDNLTIPEILSTLNPDIPDIQQHINQQFDYLEKSELAFQFQKISTEGISVFSRLLDFRFFRELFEPQKQAFLPYGDALNLDFWFDRFALIRYGFTVTGIRRAVNKNLRWRDLRSNFGSAMVPTDNAYFGRFPKCDLKTILPSHEAILAESKGDETKNVAKAIDSGAIQALNASPGNFVRRIVLLPRSTQGRSDLEVMTLIDKTVSAHEQGHFIVHAGEGRKVNVHRLADEVLADFLAVAPADNPRVGEFFASASEVIIERLKSKGFTSVADAQTIALLSRITTKKLIRDLSDDANVDSLSRFFSLAGDYDGGAPARKFLWNLRNNRGLDSTQVDELVIAAIPELSNLPTYISDLSRARLWTRLIWRRLQFNRLVWNRLQKVRQMPNAEEDESLTATALLWALETKEMTLAEFYDIADKVKRGKPAALSTSEIQALLEIVDKRKEWLIDNGVRSDGLVPRIEATQFVQSQLEKQEGQSRKMARFWRLFGFRNRPAIIGDYVLPEMFRAFYRTSAERFPDLAEAIRSEAEKAMNSSSIVITTTSGSKELVFVSSVFAKLNPLLRMKLKSLFDGLGRIKTEISKLSETDGDSENIKLLKKQYGNYLEGIQEYERTGSLRQLYFPNLRLRAVFYAFKLIKDKNKTASKTTDGQSDIAEVGVTQLFADQPWSDVCDSLLKPLSH